MQQPDDLFGLPPQMPLSEIDQEHFDGPADCPLVLVDGIEWVDLVHPEYGIFRHQDAPEGTGERVIIMREEDYVEPCVEGLLYAGLVPLVQRRIWPGTRVGADEAELAAEARRFEYPQKIACPLCPGESRILDDLSDDDGAWYCCSDCGGDVLLERRAWIRNAAVLLVPEFLGPDLF